MNLLKLLSNLPGWRTHRKLVVIESDDWGSLRAPIPGGLKKMKDLDLPIGGAAGVVYNKYDDLADKEDLESLFDVLQSIRDSNQKTAVLTAISLVANPDFERIEHNNFEKYYYKTLPEYLQIKKRDGVWDLWKEGQHHRLFVPEFHGREHLNVPAWMRALKKNDTLTKAGFKHQFWGFRSQDKSFFRYQGAFDLQVPEDLIVQHEILKDGLALFEKLHQRKASVFVPPNGPINNALEKTAAQYGIQYISSPKIQHEVFGHGKTKKNFRYLGKKNTHQQVFLTRNAFFEPSSPLKTDWIDACLKDVETAFKFNKPATISSHRVNYIGVHDQNNRKKSLKALQKLLKQIINKWPEVEFLTSAELGDIIRNTKSN